MAKDGMDTPSASNKDSMFFCHIANGLQIVWAKVQTIQIIDVVGREK
jgi:hypothetical protein